LSKDEIKLISRTFANLPVSVLISLNIPLLEQGPPKTPIEKSQPQISLVGYFKAIANLILNQNDLQSVYFSVYAVVNLINQLEFKMAYPKTDDGIRSSI
jgi:hypothetical protein